MYSNSTGILCWNEKEIQCIIDLYDNRLQISIKDVKDFNLTIFLNYNTTAGGLRGKARLMSLQLCLDDV